MKKITLIGLFGIIIIQAKSQNTPSAGIKVMTVEEANKLNGVAQPTINGQPYSQHKAEQEALRLQKAQVKTSANLPKGLPLVQGSNIAETAAPKAVDPAPTQYPGYVAPEKKQEIPAEVKASVVKNQAPSVAPEVPAQFRLQTDASWGNAPAMEAPVRNAAPAAPQVKDHPQQSFTGTKTEHYKTPVYNDVNKPSGDEGKKPDMKPADVKPIDAAITKKETAPAPEVPAQFRLPAVQSWNGREVATEAAIVKSNPAQPTDAPVAGAYKTPVMKDGNKLSGDEGKKMEMKPAPVVDAAVVAAPKKNVTVSQQAVSVAGTSLDPNAVSAEKPVNFKPGAEAVAPATEKVTYRTAADAPKPVEVSADKVQKPAAEKKNTTVPAVAGGGNGETSKVSTEPKFPQQEAPKKD